MGFMLPIIGPWLLKKGIKGTIATVIQGGVLILIAILLFLAYSSVKGHFDHIKDIEHQNEALKVKVTTVEGQRDVAININKENVKTLALDKDIRHSNEQIAAEERAAATARAQTYKEIGNAIQHTPTQPAQPGHAAVAPVITDTLNRLWSR